MRKILLFDPSKKRYHYARYSSEAGYLELGSARLEEGFRTRAPEEAFRLLATGCGDSVWCREYTTPRASRQELVKIFEVWAEKRKSYEILLSTTGR